MSEHADDRVEIAEKQAQIIELRRHGLTFRDIGARLALSRSWVHELYERALKEIPAPEVAMLREQQRGELEEVIRVGMGVLHRTHYAHSNGKVVEDPLTGEPLTDDAPKMDAARTVVLAQTRLAKLYGLDAPAQSQLELGVVRYTVGGGVDPDEDLT